MKPIKWASPYIQFSRNIEKKKTLGSCFFVFVFVFVFYQIRLNRNSMGTA